MNRFNVSGGDPTRFISEHFGAKAERYAELDVFSQEDFYRPLFDAAAPRPGEQALDLACGTGLMALMLAQVVDKVVGCDVTVEMLRRSEAAAIAAGVQNVSFVAAEASELPFDDGAFDLVTSRTAFHHFPDPHRALAEVARVLRQGGRFVIEDVYGPEEEGISNAREDIEKALDPFHIKAYSIPSLKAMLADAGLTVKSDSHPESGHMPLEIILRLENIKEPAAREHLEALLRSNLGRDLVGLRIDEIDGKLAMKWNTVIIAATRRYGA